MASLGPTFGRGAMTNSWNDIKNADVILIMGGNAAEAHPCGFKWVTEAKANNGAKLIVVDPRFTRSAAVADFYAPIRPGTDIAFLSGVMRYLLGNNKIHAEYTKAFTNASYIVKEGYGFHGRLTYAPIATATKVVHVGASAFWRRIGTGTAVDEDALRWVSRVHGTSVWLAIGATLWLVRATRRGRDRDRLEDATGQRRPIEGQHHHRRAQRGCAGLVHARNQPSRWERNVAASQSRTK